MSSQPNLFRQAVIYSMGHNSLPVAQVTKEMDEGLADYQGRERKDHLGGKKKK